MTTGLAPGAVGLLGGDGAGADGGGATARPEGVVASLLSVLAEAAAGAGVGASPKGRRRRSSQAQFLVRGAQ